MTVYMNEGTDFGSRDISDMADDRFDISNPVLMGGTSSGTGGWLIGKMDQVRVCLTIRNEAWRLACYRNQGDPDAWVTLGPARPCAPPGTVIMIR